MSNPFQEDVPFKCCLGGWKFSEKLNEKEMLFQDNLMETYYLSINQFSRYLRQNIKTPYQAEWFRLKMIDLIDNTEVFKPVYEMAANHDATAVVRYHLDVYSQLVRESIINCPPLPIEGPRLQ